MILTITSADGDIVAQLDVNPQQTAASIASRLQEQFAILPAEQILLHNGNPIGSNATFSSMGVQNEDLLVIMKKTSAAQAATPSSTGTEIARPGMRLHDIPPNASPELLLHIIEKNPQLLRELHEGNPKLAQALQTKRVADVRMVLLEMHMEEASRKFKEQEDIMALERNPFDAAAQAQIEERIRLSNVQKNMEIAIEEMPEAFARVYMLYIPCEVNGVSVKAFVDSGAQSTIMSSNCAERCGIMRLVDKRFAGQAVGVGTAKIIGRVHMAPLKIGDQFYNCSFTILDQQSVDFLFGLDMLKRHQCCIDLHKNVLSLRDGSGTHEVSFLPEHEIPTSEAPTGVPGAPATAQLPNVPAPTTSTSSSSESAETRAQKIQHLVALGFGEQQANAALDSTNGDVEHAAGLLFESLG